jgi:hypothetical protein
MFCEEFTITVEYRNKKLNALCQHYNPTGKPQIWVCVNTRSLIPSPYETLQNPDEKPEYKVYLFDILNYEGPALFSYDLERFNHQGEKIMFKGLAEVVEEVLIKNWNAFINRKNVEDVT